MLFVYEHPELGPLEWLVGFTCGPCNYTHHPGGPPIPVSDGREWKLHCAMCGEFRGTWSAPLPPPGAPAPERTIDVTCGTCGQAASLPLPLPEGAVVHCVHCGASNPLPDSSPPVDPDSAAGDNEAERST